jgi:general secretion pathway protein J
MKRVVPAGFTLIELLVALAIFAVVALLAYGGLNSVLEARTVVAAQAEELTRLQRGYRWLQQDIEQLVARPVRDAYGDTRGALLSLGTSGELLELTRGGWRNPTGQARASLQRVQYGLADGKLLRRHWLVLDQVQSSEPVERELLSGVRHIEIRFMDAERNWHQQWPPANVQGDPGLPLAAEVNLETDQWEALRWLFRLPG